MLANKRVALEIQKDITFRWFRKAGEAESDFERQEFKLAHARFAGLDLKARLFANLCIGFDGASIGFPIQRQGKVSEPLDRGDAALSQFVDLNLGDPGNEAKMIILAPTLIACDLPTADVTMYYWL